MKHVYCHLAAHAYERNTHLHLNRIPQWITSYRTFAQLRYADRDLCPHTEQLPAVPKRNGLPSPTPRQLIPPHPHTHNIHPKNIRPPPVDSTLEQHLRPATRRPCTSCTASLWPPHITPHIRHRIGLVPDGSCECCQNAEATHTTYKHWKVVGFLRDASVL